MVDAIVSSAIEKLGAFIAQEVNILLEVKDNLRWLKDELRYLQSSVRYAESRLEEELIRNWVDDVRDVANNAVKILSDFSAHQQKHAAPKQGILDRVRACVCIIKEEVTLYDIGKEIDSLKGRIAVVKDRRNEYRIDNILATPNKQQKERTLLRTTAINNQVEVVGFEDDFKTLKAELDSKDLSLKVISIHGMGGLGKTSLATKLYNSSELRQFDTHVKVCVSNEYNIKDALKRIVKSFMGPEHEQNMSTMDEHDLLQYLPKLLQDEGRYLALIDDIWDIKAWDQIKIAFPNQKNGSRIIITTRNKKLAEMVDDNCYVHQLRFLTEDESWQLFCKRAEPATPNLKKLGREMVGKCRGLPLAIVILSGLLLHNRSYNYWSKVKEHIWRQLKVGGSFQIEEILSLSYNDLSLRMRDCFLYLARYPEDHEIYSEELKLQWMAEEFISEADEGGEVMEELAEDYLNELINRNLLQVESRGWNRQVESCRVHDLVRDLAINKAKDQKLLAILDSGKQQTDAIHLLEGAARHVIYNGIGEYMKLLERRFDASYLRSLTLVKYLGGKVEIKEIKLVCTRFKNLKVLDMTSLLSDIIPEEIGDLVHLKYLGLTCYSQEPIEIPSSVGKLKNLQTLRGSSDSSYTVPPDICELHELRNIGFTIQFKQWMKIDTVNITKLHTLHVYDDQGDAEEGYSYTLESITNLTSLQTFTLCFEYGDIPTIKPLSFCNRLRSVELSGTLRDPSELRHLPDSVTDLSLIHSEFREDPMPDLGSLSNLTALQLLNEVYSGNKMVCSENGFPSLQILRLKCFYDLEELEIGKGAFPSLEQFQTLSCIKMKKFPIQLAEPIEDKVNDPGKGKMHSDDDVGFGWKNHDVYGDSDDSNDSFNGDDDDKINDKKFIGNMNDVVPCVGMKFDSLDEAESFYRGYGRNVRNVICDIRRRVFYSGDAECGLVLLRDLQKQSDGNFFYRVDVDEENRVRGLVWVDPHSLNAYKNFGDVVTFDSTYRTNRYDMPFIPITGVNHHYQNILFGFALVRDEKETSYRWVLKTWLEAVDNKPPITIITDQDIALSNAIAEVMPNTNHTYCTWHISSKFLEKLSTLYTQYSEFKTDFNAYIYKSLSPTEFEGRWEDLKEKYDLENHN
ncbi:putative disease resistance RPP13-like protein 3 [Apium graveolens]|uniref:putative disease resistance RPP13-like protein 3 n=1 Tax=Apium graveolens TaxID=4045 RepID=UPI003D7AB16D